MLTNDYPERVEVTTEALYRDDNLNCAESVLKALLVEAGHACPPELLKLASAFGHGMGGAGCACGALVGGEMAIGYFLGRTESKGKAPAGCTKAAKELHSRFVALNRATCCRILHKGLKHGTPEQKQSCALRSGGGGRLAAQLLLELQQAAASAAAGTPDSAPEERAATAGAPAAERPAGGAS